nr:ribonuclease H-like domain-containing protein [Tanacetum cinerariifolium]
MYVHNSKHNTSINSDNDDDINDSVTRISKLDISDPLHLHRNDTTALTVVSIKLKGTENYHVWSCAMLLALEGKNKIGFIDRSCKRSNTDEVLGKQWDMYDAMIELPKCVCNASEGFKKHNQLLKLMQFLMGLDDSYMQIRSSILSRETFCDVRSAYATISSEESHRVTVGSIVGSCQRNQASAFVSNVPYSQSFQRNNQNFNAGPSRPNNVNNNRPSGGSGFVSENYGFNGHTIDRCFKIIGYPAGFEKKKFGQNVKKQSVSNNNSVGKSSSSGFTDEQLATLISLIKDNKVGKNVHANMAGANHHMTYTDKELDNVIDISHLKIEDLNLKNVLGIDEQCEGLYYYSDKDLVLHVLKDSLNFDKSDNTGCCKICQRAKQTREHFPLSYHKSKNLGDLVHLDLWGPYKVASSEGFRFFLTVVDDYTKAVLVYLIKSKDEIPNDDERVANDMNKGKSDSSSSSESGNNINTVDFLIDSGNDADSSNDFVVTQNEEVATLEENIFSEVLLKVFKMLEGLLDKVFFQRIIMSLLLNQSKTREPKTYFEASKYSHWIDVMNQKMNALLRNGTWELVELPEGKKAIGSKWIYKIKFRFSQSKSDYSLYTKSDKGVFLALLVYVDDIIITGNIVSEIEKFKVFLKSKFMIKDLGKLKYFLGIEVVDTDK